MLELRVQSYEKDFRLQALDLSFLVFRHFVSENSSEVSYCFCHFVEEYQ